LLVSAPVMCIIFALLFIDTGIMVVSTPVVHIQLS